VASDTGVLDAYSVDISGGGMLMTGPEALEPGDQIRFRLHIGADETPIEGRARVVRSDGGGRRAIAFEQIPRHEEERLVRFLFDRQRAERACTPGDARRARGTR
jgi:c-di-GMP-binding flagellar brake protein YcgR